MKTVFNKRNAAILSLITGVLVAVSISTNQPMETTILGLYALALTVVNYWMFNIKPE